MTKEEENLIIAEQNKSTEEILKAVTKMKADYNELCKLKDMRIAELEEENDELKAQFWGAKPTCNNCGHCLCENYQTQRKSEPCSLWCSYRDILTKAKDIIKKLKALYFSPVVTKNDVKRQDEILAETEQFLKEVEE